MPMIIRKDTGLSSVDYSMTYTDHKGANTTTTYSGSCNKTLALGVNLPGYHKRKASGALIPHTKYYRYEGSGRVTDGSFYSVSKSNSSAWYRYSNWRGLASVPGFSFKIDDFADPIHAVEPPDLSFTELYLQRAASNLYTKGWDGLTFGAELGKTVKMFSKTASNFYRFGQLWRRQAELGRKDRLLLSASRSRKRQRGPRKRTGDDVMDFWAESRYGWRTLGADVRDMYDAYEAFKSKRKIWSERVGDGYTVDNSYQAYTGLSIGHLLYDCYVTDITTYSIRGSVAAMIQPRNILIDPILTGYEILPWSFVLDWVIDVGSVLGAMQFLRYSHSHTASAGWIATRKVTYDWSGYESSTHTGHASNTWEYETTQTSRQPRDVSLKPQFTGRSLSSDLILDMRALFRTKRNLAIRV